jgi:hypothetical protein
VPYGLSSLGETVAIARSFASSKKRSDVSMTRSPQQESESRVSEPIRDFLYVDDELVTSLYSQIFEGVAESIVETYVYGSSKEQEVSGTPFSGQEISETVKEGGKTAQSRVLYDHMYSQLEAKLESAIEEPPALELATCSNSLSGTNLLRVTGNTSVADFEFLKRITENWSAIGDAIVEAQVEGSKEEREAKRDSAKRRLENTSDRNDQARLEKILESIPSHDDVRQQLKNELGLHAQSDWIEEHLSLILSLWFGANFEAVIERPIDEGVAFRGALKEQGLRQKKSIQRLSNAGRILRGDWTMVGLVQRVPDYAPDPDDSSDSDQSQGEDSLLRDSFRNIFQKLDQVNEVIYMSGERREVLVRPLAIYRKLSVLG